MQVTIGSNVFRGSTGVLVAEGEEQITLEVGEDGQALLSMSIYDRTGDLVGKLRRNAWVYNERDHFDITTAPSALTLFEKSTPVTILKVSVTSRTEVKVTEGDFYTKGGTRILVTPEQMTIGSIVLSGNVMENSGQHIVLGPG